MRFIIKEQPYEKPLAAGKWRYERDGRATGAVEQWRLTEAADDYRFLRVDVDGRAAPSKQTTLYHALLNGNGRVERLKFRGWVSGSWRVAGDVVFADGLVTAVRDINGEKHEQVLELPSDFLFWFPSSSGLGLLVGLESGVYTAVSLAYPEKQPTTNNQQSTTNNQQSTTNNQQSTFGLFETALKIEQAENHIVVSWADQERRLWLDEQNWPVKMARGDGLTAVAHQRIHYQRITNPGGQN